MPNTQPEVTKEQVKAGLLITIELARAVLDSVANVHPLPAPEGPLYLAFMQKGLSLSTYQKLMARLVELNLLQYIGSNQFILSSSEVKRRGLVEHLQQYPSKEYSYGL